MDKFEDLQAFVAVVEAGSFTAAAQRLDVAKSAVSRRVSALEERRVRAVIHREAERARPLGTRETRIRHAAERGRDVKPRLRRCRCGSSRTPEPSTMSGRRWGPPGRC